MDGGDISQMLGELGFTVGSICEAIVTTVNRDGIPSAAPMGVRRSGPDLLEVEPFKTSATYWNLLSNQRACVNVTDDPALFLVTAFKEEAFDGFPDARVDGNLRLNDSDAYVFVDVVENLDLSKIRSRFNCRATDVEISRASPRVFSRGRAEAIEAVVHATRIKVFAREGDAAAVERLIKRFNECKDVVNRVSPPGSSEGRVMLELERLIEEWGEAV